MSRGPNPTRVVSDAAWWTEGRDAIERRYGEAFSRDSWNKIKFALLNFKAQQNDVKSPSSAEYRKDLDGAIARLESAMTAVASVISFDRENAALAEVHSKLEFQYGRYRIKRGDFPLKSPGDQSQQLPSEADAKAEACGRIADIAQDTGLDAKRLVRACNIHEANSEEAWDKWWNRTKPPRS